MPNATTRGKGEFKPRLLQNEGEYDTAVAEITRLLDQEPKPGTPNDRKLQFLTVLVEAYDREHHPLGETGTPQSAVAFMLEQRGMTRKDLEPLLGSKSRVSEFFSRKRSLSINQIKALRTALNLPADLLVE